MAQFERPNKKCFGNPAISGQIRFHIDCVHCKHRLLCEKELIMREDLEDRKMNKLLIGNLKEKIRYHEHKYYVENKPEIPDKEFDKLMQILKYYESVYPELVTPDSPTQRIYDGTLCGFEPVKHKAPMLSLDNSFDFDNLDKFDARVRRQLEQDVSDLNLEYVVELKIDGCGITLLYEDGVLFVDQLVGMEL